MEISWTTFDPSLFAKSVHSSTTQCRKVLCLLHKLLTIVHEIQSESFKSNFWRVVAVVVVAGVLAAVDGPAGIRGASRWGAVMLLVSVVLTVGVVVAPKLVGAAKQ